MRGATAQQLAGLPGMPATSRAVRLRAATEGWSFTVSTQRGGAVRLYPISTLPAATQRALAELTASDPAVTDAGRTVAQRAEVAERLPLVRAIAEQLTSGARSLDAAIAAVAPFTEHSPRTLRRWYDAVRSAPPEEWAARLAPGWRAGRCGPAECHPNAWAVFRDSYLRDSKPPFQMAYDDAVKVAKHFGWEPVPPLSAMVRRFKRETPFLTIVLRREGPRALERYFPSQIRDKSRMHPLAVNADGHRVDVHVRWPDGKIKRPYLVGFQSIPKAKILAWRIDRSENTEVCRLAFADLVTEYGIPPYITLDNGMAWASKAASGGTATRFRSKVRDDDPLGFFCMLGSEVHWAQPYHGQSKGIERAWRDLATRIAKRPEFAGAYCGNSVPNRPESWAEEHAVDLDVFLRVCAIEIKEHNAREGRTAVAGASFDTAFAAAYEQAIIRKASEQQRRALWLSSEHVTVRTNGNVNLSKVRDPFYWAPELCNHIGTKVTLRYDPDHLGAGVHVYDCKGNYLCHAQAHGSVPYDSQRAAAEHAKATSELRRATKSLAKAQQTFTEMKLPRADGHS